MPVVTITLDIPEGATFDVATRPSPPRLALPRRCSPGLPVKTFLAAFQASSEDGETADAAALRDAFAETYPSRSGTDRARREAVRKALRRALNALAEEFVIERRVGVEVLRRVDEPQAPRPPPPPSTGNSVAVVPSISATRGARTPRSGRGG